MQMPLNLVILIDKQGPIFYIPLHAYEYEPFCFFAAVSMVGVAWPPLYIMYWRRMSRVQWSGFILDTVATGTSAETA